jgi:ribonuclease PH
MNESLLTDIASRVPAFSFGRSCDISSIDLSEGATTEGSMRPSGRAVDAMRPVTFEPGAAKYAEGSCLAKFGDTHVLCTASVEERVPPFLRNSGRGWVTAEYGMLPRSTATRTDREATRGRQSGRTQEIQRLIGRSLRAVTDLTRLGERQIRIDCDVLQADGGTRTAAVTGSYVALHLACERLLSGGLLTSLPLRDSVGAISCGVIAGAAVLDLDYAEDSQAETDANFVLTGTGGIVEIQATAEAAPFDEALFAEMLRLARGGIAELTRRQRATLGLG